MGDIVFKEKFESFFEQNKNFNGENFKIIREINEIDDWVNPLGFGQGYVIQIKEKYLFVHEIEIID